MSIINQALKKAQREQQMAPGGPAWMAPAASETAAPRRRGPALWIVSAALFALSLGVTLHAWLGSPTARVETVVEPGRPATAAIPRSPAATTNDAGTALTPPRQVAAPVSAPRAAQPESAGVIPVPPVRAAAARQPAPPPTAAGYTARGNAFYHQGAYQRAVAMYEAALALDPLDVKARNNLGSAYLQLDLDERARAAFREVLRLDASYGLAYYNLACVHGRAGDAAGAAEYLQQAAAIEPRARDWARTDGDFAAVRNTPAFRQLLEP